MGGGQLLAVVRRCTAAANGGGVLDVGDDHKQQLLHVLVCRPVPPMPAVQVVAALLPQGPMAHGP
jgi:hypothetical protein